MSEADVAAIVTKLPGYVADIKVTDNQRVKAGDILVVLDVSDIKPKSDQAVAATASKAAVSNIERNSNCSRRSSTRLMPASRSAKADAERARSDARRYEALADRGVVSRQRLDAWRARTFRA